MSENQNGISKAKLHARGELIRRLRLERVLTQPELADKAGIGFSTVRALERGQVVRPESVRAVASALEVAASEIVEVRE